MEFIPLSWSVVIIQVLGLPGLIFVIWHFDNKRLAKHEEARKREVAQLLQQYREDVSEIKRLYESNVRLVEDFSLAYKRLEAVHGEAMSVIGLNTQVQTRLVEAVKTNQFCPAMRIEGGRG